jgi:hypothetical protein
MVVFRRPAAFPPPCPRKQHKAATVASTKRDQNEGGNEDRETGAEDVMLGYGGLDGSSLLGCFTVALGGSMLRKKYPGVENRSPQRTRRI